MTDNDKSFLRNKGKISYTYKDNGDYGEFLNDCRLSAWKTAIDKYGIERDSVFDIGCSYGSWHSNYKDVLGFGEIFGLDPNEQALSDARELYDQVFLGDARSLSTLNQKASLYAANGVIVHILSNEEEAEFYHAIFDYIAPGDFFFFTILNSKHYVTPAGFEPWSGPNSCTKEVQTHLDLATKVGFKVIDQIGTFINPWFTQDTTFIAGSENLKLDPRLYSSFHLLGETLRDNGNIELFSEILIVAQK